MTHYVIRVAGLLSDDLLIAFPRLAASTEPVTTVLQGQLPDQAALTAVLDRLDELGIDIIELNTLPEMNVLEPSKHLR